MIVNINSTHIKHWGLKQSHLLGIAIFCVGGMVSVGPKQWGKTKEIKIN